MRIFSVGIDLLFSNVLKCLYLEVQIHKVLSVEFSDQEITQKYAL